MTAVRGRASGVVVASTVAGLALGLADAADAIAGGFAASLGALELATVVVTASLAIGLAGAFAGLIAAGVWAVAARLGIATAPVVTAAVVSTVGALFAMSLWVLYGNGATNRLGAAVVGGGALATFAALVPALRRCPRAVHAAAWVAAIGGLYALETRLIYMFSRRSSFAPVHIAGLLLLLGISGVGLWLASARARRAVARRIRPAQIAVAAVMALAIAAAWGVEHRGSHDVRLMLHERLSLAFRPMSLAPGASGRPREIRRWLGAGCPSTDLLPSPAIARPQPVRGVVLILIDSLRGDRLDARRGGQPLTPNLTRLARRSALFPNAYTPAPGTTEALTELLSDQFAAALRDAGIRTAAVAGQANLARFAPMFEWFDDSAAIERREAYKNALTSEAIAGRAAAALDALAGADRFFLVAHFFDPHAHYVVNPAFDFGRGEAARYDAEVAYTDRWLGGLVDRVIEAGDLALIVTSDHGDELWEHRYKRHQLRLYDESTRVPIVAFHPRGVGGESFGAEVSLVDVAPTTLDMLGIGGGRVPGRSLWPAITGAAPPAARPIGLRSTSGALWGVVSGRRKLIFDRHRGILEYYDLEHDPGERRNLADIRPDAMKPLACALDQHMKAHGL